MPIICENRFNGRNDKNLMGLNCTVIRLMFHIWWDDFIQQMSHLAAIVTHLLFLESLPSHKCHVDWDLFQQWKKIHDLPRAIRLLHTHYDRSLLSRIELRALIWAHCLRQQFSEKMILRDKKKDNCLQFWSIIIRMQSTRILSTSSALVG